MSIETWHLMIALLAGSAIGFFYFGGLWLTVQRIPSSSRPQLLLVGSFFLRLFLSLAAFYLLVPWGWPAMAAALAGLIMIRQILIRIKKNKLATTF
ncbi:MAG TPA: ATP synthase subunit I [Desulfuromonadales bacterium]|nr:ATP synthase subunit I [Desulfuromonadales bacterium]